MPTNELRGFLRDHLILGSVELPEQRQGEEVGTYSPPVRKPDTSGQDVSQHGTPTRFRTPTQFCTPAAGETYDLAINRNHDGTLFHWMLRKPGHTGEPIAEGDFPAGTTHPGRDQLVAMIGAETNLVLQRLGRDERQGFWEWITVRVQSTDDVGSDFPPEPATDLSGQGEEVLPEVTPAAVDDEDTSDRWHNRRKYLDRPAAIQSEIVDPIEHDNNVADAWLAFDVEAIADEVLAYDAASQTYRCICGPFKFWAVVRNHEIQED